MRQAINRALIWYWRVPRFSPGGLLAVALEVTVVFAILHACGLREATSVLSGTVPVEGATLTIAMMKAFVYIVFYLGAVLLAPVLIIASGVMFAVERLWQARSPRATAAGE